MKYTLLFGMLYLLSSCVSIPTESIELSSELGKQITAIQKSNLALLDNFFEQKEQKIDDFIQTQWLPVFANNLFTQPDIIKAWDVIVKEDDKEQRLLFLLKVGTKLQTVINKKRMEMIQPLIALKQKVKSNMNDNYNQMLAINNGITSFLVSAATVETNYNRYLGLLKIKGTKVTDKVDKALSWLDNTKDKIHSIQQYLDALNAIKL